MRQRFRKMLIVWLLGGGLTLMAVAAEFGNPVDEVLKPTPPRPPGAGSTPLVLAPKAPRAPRRPAGPATSLQPADSVILRPPTTRRRRSGPAPKRFALEDHDRVILLGGLFRESLECGSLETRLSSQDPKFELRFRNLGWPDAGLVGLEKDGQPGPRLAKLLRAAAAFKPTVVFVSLGKQDAREQADTNAFGAAFDRLLDRLAALNPDGATRLAVVSPSGYEPKPGARIEAQPANDRLAAYVMQTYRAATNRPAPFVNLFGFSIWDSRTLRKHAEAQQTRMHFYTSDGVALNPHGFWRLTFGLEKALNWPANTWRWGLMPDNTFRDGGFGTDILQHQRTDTGASVHTKAWRLPTPNPAGYGDLSTESQPHCYIQAPGFKPGRYELRVDSHPVLTGTHEEWARYEIISDGPDWDQAEQLRRAIVAKNQHVQEWLAGFDDPVVRQAAEAAIAEAETEIAKLRVPPKRRYQILRVGAVSAPQDQPTAQR